MHGRRTHRLARRHIRWFARRAGGRSAAELRLVERRTLLRELRPLRAADTRSVLASIDEPASESVLVD
jgi:hypothetical protein